MPINEREFHDKTWRSFAERMKDRRKQKGWTQKKLAERAGISQDSVSKAEQNKARLGFDHLVKICFALEASPDAMMGWEKNVLLETNHTTVERFRELATQLPAIQVVAILDLMDKLKPKSPSV